MRFDVNFLWCNMWNIMLTCVQSAWTVHIVTHLANRYYCLTQPSLHIISLLSYHPLIVLLPSCWSDRVTPPCHCTIIVCPYHFLICLMSEWQEYHACAIAPSFPVTINVGVMGISHSCRCSIFSSYYHVGVMGISRSCRCSIFSSYYHVGVTGISCSCRCTIFSNDYHVGASPPCHCTIILYSLFSYSLAVIVLPQFPSIRSCAQHNATLVAMTIPTIPTTQMPMALEHINPNLPWELSVNRLVVVGLKTWWICS